MSQNQLNGCAISFHCFPRSNTSSQNSVDRENLFLPVRESGHYFQSKFGWQLNCVVRGLSLWVGSIIGSIQPSSGSSFQVLQVSPKVVWPLECGTFFCPHPEPVLSGIEDGSFWVPASSNNSISMIRRGDGRWKGDDPLSQFNRVLLCEQNLCIYSHQHYAYSSLTHSLPNLKNRMNTTHRLRGRHYVYTSSCISFPSSYF